MLTKPKIQPCSVFQSTLPRGSDAVHTSGNVALCYFNPRSGAGHCGIRCTHFNPRSLAGATVSTRFLRPITLFQSTLPLTGATQARIIYRLVAANFNPRSLTGATLDIPLMTLSQWISIHAPSRERLTAFGGMV